MIAQQQLTSRLNEGIAHHQAGRFDRAEAIYRQVATQAPRLAVVHDLMGRLAEQQGRTDEAIRSYRQALALDPRSVSAAVQLSSIYITTSRAPEAEKLLRKLTTDLPKNFDAWNALGFALKIMGRLDEAIECHRRAVTLNPKFVEGWLHYGLTLMIANRNAEALEKYQRALALRPGMVGALHGRAQVLHKTYHTEEAIRDYDAVLAGEPRNFEARSYRFFALQTLPTITREQLFAEHRKYGELVGSGPRVLPDYDYSPAKRLRVAILSPDLRIHSCAYFIEPLLRGLPREEFEVYLYHDHFIEDAVSARLRTYAAVWRNFVGQAPAVFERTVRADKPDILIDLTGHVGNTIRLPSFAKRLAPVQITYLGYPDTTGVPAIDYRFTDGIADPIGEADAFATERLVRFAPVAWTYQAPDGSPDVTPPPAAAGAPITFGCFNGPTKYNSFLFQTWARLLMAVPGSRLLIKGDFDHADIRKHMLEWLQRDGVPVERVELLARTPDTRSHLECYAKVDIALDSFPYNGTTTTCEALWMGRPVVTLCGDRHASRVGASLLNAVARPEWVGKTSDEYISIAVRLASDHLALAEQSRSLRAALRSSALMDHAGQAVRFGAALRECWQQRAALAADRAAVGV